MTKAELIDRIAENGEITKKKATEAYDAVISGITDSLISGEKISIYGFGTFDIIQKKERAGVNPKTGEKITIAARSAVKFKPAKELKDKLAAIK
jgi:DNA-binding protein HU-beta